MEAVVTEENKLEFKSILEGLSSIPEVSVYTEAHEPLQELLSELDTIVPSVLQAYSLPIFKTSFQTPSDVSIAELKIEINEAFWEGKVCYQVLLRLISAELPQFQLQSWISPQLLTWHETYENEFQGIHQTIWYHEESYFVKEKDWVRCPSTFLFQGATWVLGCILLQTDMYSTIKEVFMYTTYAKNESELVTITVIPTSYPNGLAGPWLGLHFDPPQWCNQMYQLKKKKSNSAMILFNVFQSYLACQKQNLQFSKPSHSHPEEIEKFDLEFESIFYDQKDSEKAQIEAYLKSHPELTQLISEWTKSVLTVKPENIFDHARNYFDLS
ncbi:hypothetical protein HMI55_005152 [Coelomomyces lativittatus]|nr:hypothetical protein HMI55_005152 [Coelomomyces lativittatus]